jgi:XTP/dITP diphosphohydrolase
MNDERLTAFKRLLDIMDAVREKCPWDKKQTFDSLRYLTIEETYELSDAILEKKYDDVAKELGDLMLHIVFYAKIGQEEDVFTITDVLNGISEKLVRRHLIFLAISSANEDDVKNYWERIKLKEGKRFCFRWSSTFITAMDKAYRNRKKRAELFRLENTEPVRNKVQEEFLEFCHEKRSDLLRWR